LDRFVNRLIAARGHLPLVSCEVEEAYLTWDDYAGEPEEPEPNLYFDSWIQYALACKVQVLKVDVVGCGWELIVPLISQHLRNLDVHHVYWEKDSVDFSSCPVLEELKIEKCGLWVRSMSFPSLKRLFFTECNFPVDHRVRISAPAVVSLRLLRCGGKQGQIQYTTVAVTGQQCLSSRLCTLSHFVSMTAAQLTT
jgi:hypothetical protein